MGLIGGRCKIRKDFSQAILIDQRFSHKNECSNFMQNKKGEGLKLTLFFVLLLVVVALVFYLTPSTIAGIK